MSQGVILAAIRHSVPVLIFASGMLTTAAASAQAAPPAACQDAPADRFVAIGGCIHSSIGPEDAKNEDNIPYEDWRLRLQPGQIVQIDMDADALAGATADLLAERQFDTYLELRAPSGQVVAINDDRPGATNSRIRQSASEAGEYVIRARPLVEGGGTYSLRVTTVRPPSEPIPITQARTEGVLNVASEESEQWPGFRTQRYSIEGRAGERIRIRLRSPGRTKTMDLRDDQERVLASLDGIGGDLQIISVLPQAARYVLQVNIAEAEENTPFVIELERRSSSAAPAPRILRIGEALPGEIGLDSEAIRDPLSDQTVLAELFQLAVRAGDVITVAAESDAFDIVLDAGTLSPIGFAPAMTNDDSGGTRNSLLVLRAERNGIVHLRVRPLGNGFGPFRLTTRQGRADAAYAADADYTQLVFIQFAGLITRQEIVVINSSLLANGWRVQGSSGERIATAAGLNEVRYSADEDRAAAEGLAAALTQASIGSAPVTARRVGIIRPGTLEAWISN